LCLQCVPSSTPYHRSSYCRSSAFHRCRLRLPLAFLLLCICNCGRLMTTEQSTMVVQDSLPAKSIEAPRQATAVRRQKPITIEWEDYPRIRSGEYSAYGVWARKYRDPAFKRWTCLLRFDVLRENRIDVIARIPMWLALGSGDVPRASRRSRYLREWVDANGGPFSRGDRLSPQVFVHRMARIEVGDTTKGPVPYSVVKKILRWETGFPCHSVNKSDSQGQH